MSKLIKNKHIILGVTGSIAAYKACDLVSKLVQAEAKVTVVMTKSALKLVTAHTFYALSKQPVICEMFNDDFVAAAHIEHINLADEGDILVIAPATANIIGKIASGIADDILTTTVMAFPKKVIIAPAMNNKMYVNKIVQDNIAKLKAYGYIFVDPEDGYLACGYEGKGRLANIAKIIDCIGQQIK